MLNGFLVQTLSGKLLVISEHEVVFVIKEEPEEHGNKMGHMFPNKTISPLKA